MATAKISITDGPHGVICVVESDPPIPLIDRQGTPDVRRITDAQSIAIGAMMAICEQVGESDFRVLLKDD
jgi:hypothetical protein